MKIFESLGLLFVVLLIYVPLVFLYGWVLQNIWLWFIVPFGIKEISFVHAIGLGLVISLFRLNESTDDDDDKLLEKVLMAFFSPLLILFVGWIVQMFM